MTDLQDRKNRLEIGVEKIETQEAVEKELNRLGIPREVVIIEERGYPLFLSHESLRDEVGPIIGALQAVEATLAMIESARKGRTVRIEPVAV